MSDNANPAEASIVLIYTTAPDQAVAEQIASALLDKRLIACANILPGMTALYHWNGAVARDSEVAMILKTRATLADAAIREGRTLHPYTTPAFVVLPVSDGSAAFLDWIRGETAT